jgi:hypothetical protein
MQIINLTFTEFDQNQVIRVILKEDNDFWFVVEDVSKLVGVSAFNLYSGLPLEDKLAINVLVNKARKNKICISYSGLLKALNRVGNKLSVALIPFIINEINNLESEAEEKPVEAKTTLKSDAKTTSSKALNIPPANLSFSSRIESIVDNRIQAERLTIIYTEDILDILGLKFTKEDDRYKIFFTSKQNYPVFYYPLKRQWTMNGDANTYKSADVIDFIVQATQKSMGNLHAWMTKKMAEDPNSNVAGYTTRIIEGLQSLQDKAKEIRQIEFTVLTDE